MSAVESPDRDAYTVGEAARRCGVNEKTIYDEIKAGRMRSRKLGRKHLITPAAITEWLDALPAA